MSTYSRYDLVRIIVILCLLFLRSSTLADEILIHGQTAILHAAAGAACPPDDAVINDDSIAWDLVDYQHSTQADTSSACGSASGSGSLTSQVGASFITADMAASASLTDHSGCLGSAYFQFEFEVTSPVTYTMTVLGNFVGQGVPGLTGYRIALGTQNTEIHVAQANEPDFDLIWEGQLEPGISALEGSCTSSRAARSLGGGEWVFENGDATITGSVSLDFHDGMIVGTEQVSLGAMRAMFR